MENYSYLGISVNNNHICFQASGKSNSYQCEVIDTSIDTAASIISWIANYESKNNTKVIAAGVDKKIWTQVYSRLWLEADCFPLLHQTKEQELLEPAAKQAAEFVRSLYKPDGSFPAKVKRNRRVEVFPLVKIEDYEKITPPEEFQKLISAAEKLKGKKIVFISATPQGGGVALMRHSLIRLSRLLSLDINWLVLLEDKKVFNITKRKFHNVLQGVAFESEFLEEKEKKIFEKWSKKNFELMKNDICEADIIVSDDPQTVGLIPYIKKYNKDARLIYRSHIHLMAKEAEETGTNQHITWQYLYKFIKQADLFVSHPIKDFVPKKVKKDMKVTMMGASTDPLDGLNKELSQEQQRFYLASINARLKSLGQKPIDLNRSYITQIARFDPSKGIPDLIQSYRKMIDKLKNNGHSVMPQLVIAGHASIDDPDGAPIYKDVTNVLQSADYKDIAPDIKVLRLPHHDQLLNVILRNASIALQLSHREGFEVKVSEALLMGKPVVVYSSGGIPLQVENEKNGYIVQTGDTEAVSEKLLKLIKSPKTYESMSLNAKKLVPITCTTVGKATQWFDIFNEIHKD